MLKYDTSSSSCLTYTFSNTIWLPPMRAEKLPELHTPPCASGLLTLMATTVLNHKVCSPGKQTCCDLENPQSSRSAQKRILTKKANENHTCYLLLSAYHKMYHCWCLFWNHIFNNHEPFIFILINNSGGDYTILVFKGLVQFLFCLFCFSYEAP